MVLLNQIRGLVCERLVGGDVNAESDEFGVLREVLRLCDGAERELGLIAAQVKADCEHMRSVGVDVATMKRMVRNADALLALHTPGQKGGRGEVVYVAKGE
jgi:hypothetical protein